MCVNYRTEWSRLIHLLTPRGVTLQCSTNNAKEDCIGVFVSRDISLYVSLLFNKFRYGNAVFQGY